MPQREENQGTKVTCGDGPQDWRQATNTMVLPKEKGQE